MLGSIELIFGFVSAWIISSCLLFFVKRINRENLPSGSITCELKDPTFCNQLIGSTWTRLVIMIGFGIGSIMTLGILILCIFSVWEKVPSFAVFDFPLWINWTGLATIWISYAWGTSVLYYNPNYTPLYSRMKDEYILATGGPYKIIRHPMYIQKAIFPILLFLTTGFWLSLLGLISWIALPSQTKAEEEMLQGIFGNNYTEYFMKTGRFFPKITIRTIE